jgi:hypothetical protein
MVALAGRVKLKGVHGHPLAHAYGKEHMLNPFVDPPLSRFVIICPHLVLKPLSSSNPALCWQANKTETNKIQTKAQSVGERRKANFSMRQELSVSDTKD